MEDFFFLTTSASSLSLSLSHFLPRSLSPQAGNAGSVASSPLVLLVENALRTGCGTLQLRLERSREGKAKAKMRPRGV